VSARSRAARGGGSRRAARRAGPPAAAPPDPRRRRLALAATFVLPSALLCAAATWVGGRYRIDPPERLSAEARAAAMAPLRAALDGGTPARPRSAELERPLDQGGPVLATVWQGGLRVTRVQARGERVADAVLAAATALAANNEVKSLSGEERQSARIQLDLVTARGPLLQSVEVLSPFALHPGLEGLGAVTAGPEEHLLTPEDLIRHRLLVSRKPLPAIPDVRAGLDLARADSLFALDARVTLQAWAVLDRSYFRFRTDAFVEPPGPGSATPPGAPRPARAAPLPLVRGAPPAPPLTAANLRAAAVAGGHYLVNHLADNGRYVYEADLASGRSSDPKKPRPYSLPRHAGTTYFLAQLYGRTREPFLLEPIERAFGHFAQLVEEGGCTGKTGSGAPFACVQQKGDRTASLGSTALAVVALCEYRAATRSNRFDDLTRKLAEWLLFMQRPDGTFAHLYDARAGRRDEEAQLLYFSGEAALALVRMHAVFGEARYLGAAERALDRLVEWYDFFAGGFFYGEEHWTCIAAEAAWPALRHDRYRAFCDGYGRFLRGQQVREDDFADQPDMAGTYGVTPFVLPNNTPVGSRTEAMISAYLLGVHHGRPSEPIREQILRSMRFAMRQQIRPESDFWVARAAKGLGGIPSSAIDPTVRIDYVQHVSSAMLRAAELLAPAK
jgi:hypothetical protein